MQGHIVLKPSTNVSVTVSNSTVSLATPPTAANAGILTVEAADVRCRWDGSDPVAGVKGGVGGLLMPKNSVWEISGRDFFASMIFIRDGSTDAVVSVNYIKGE